MALKWLENSYSKQPLGPQLNSREHIGNMNNYPNSSFYRSLLTTRQYWQISLQTIYSGFTKLQHGDTPSSSVPSYGFPLTTPSKCPWTMFILHRNCIIPWFSYGFLISINPIKSHSTSIFLWFSYSVPQKKWRFLHDKHHHWLHSSPRLGLHGAVLRRVHLRALGADAPGSGEEVMETDGPFTMGKPQENGGLMGIDGIYPLVMTVTQPLKIAISSRCSH